MCRLFQLTVMLLGGSLAIEEASYITGQLIVVDGSNTIQEYKDTNLALTYAA